MKNKTSDGLLGKALRQVAAATGELLRRRAPYSFHDKVALVTGGSRGLGLVLARQLLDQGASGIVLFARDEAELQRAAEELRARGGDVITCVGDVAVPEQAQSAVLATVRRFGRIDVLINNAGVIQVGPLQHMQLADFAEAMGVHFFGPLYTMTAALPYMRSQGGGRIINVASIGGKVPVPQLAPYCASKFALVGLSSGVRGELLSDNIVVTTVCPWLMRTGSHFNALFKGQHKQAFAEFAIADALPGFSVPAERAARQILQASQKGRAELIIAPQARLLAKLSALLPESFATGLAAMGKLMPGPIDHTGDVPHSGWDSRSVWAPSLLTRLADQATVENNELKGHPAPV